MFPKQVERSSIHQSLEMFITVTSIQIIINFKLAARIKLQEIYNHSWAKGTASRALGEATTMPIHKTGGNLSPQATDQ